MADTSDGNSNDQCDEVFSLKDFSECFDLPKWVEVVGGKDVGPIGSGPCNIQKGMILLLRTLAVDSVTLSFNDAETGKRIVSVSPNSQVKFTVQLPYPDFKNPAAPRTVYNTVAELLKVCPTFFKANVFYDDPYLPAIVKAGEVFKFIRKLRRPNERRMYLQCRDPEGNIIELPEECRGDFTAVEDEESYTLKELLDLGPIDRKLKLSRDHVQLSFVPEAGDNGHDLYSNLKGSESSNLLQRIMGLPLSYDGLLTLHQPKMFLAASPSENQQEVWKVPLDIDIKVKAFCTDDYEKPLSSCEIPDMGSPPPPFKVYKLCELLDTYHEDFPVLATLVHYKDMPVEFTHCLSPGCELIVHNIERQDRLLAKAGHKYFSIARNMPGKFRKTLRKFRSIADMKYMFPDPLQEDVCVKILQDVASDSPVQFSLATGDVVKFKTFQAKTHKVKLKSKTYSECSVIHCEKRRENGKFEKILLPDDLDILVHELPSPSKVDGFCIDEVFRYRPELPFSVDFLADYNSMWGCLPVSSEIMFTNFVTEPLAVISQLSKADEDSDTRRHIDNRVRDCLLVPARHFMMLTVKERLGFPSNYFMFPDKNVFIGCAVEKISKQAFDDLIRHNDLSYEDYDGMPSANAESAAILPYKSKRGSEEKLNKRLSKTFNTMIKSRPKILTKIKKRFSANNLEELSTDTSSAVENQMYGAGSIHSTDDGDQYDDENLYEHVQYSIDKKS